MPSSYLPTYLHHLYSECLQAGVYLYTLLASQLEREMVTGEKEARPSTQPTYTSNTVRKSIYVRVELHPHTHTHFSLSRWGKGFYCRSWPWRADYAWVK